MKTNNVTEKLDKHMATPHTPGKRHKASNDYIYMNWKLASGCVTTPKAGSDMNITEKEHSARVGTGYKIEMKSNMGPGGPSGHSDLHIKATVPINAFD